MLSASGDDYFVVEQQRRHQISVGLAGTRAGLGHQHFGARHGSGHCLGHLLLGSARREAGERLRQRAVGAEDVSGRQHRSGPANTLSLSVNVAYSVASTLFIISTRCVMSSKEAITAGIAAHGMWKTTPNRITTSKSAWTPATYNWTINAS